ncbi:ThuA domain-containing protein [Flectobacillus rivi]|uniref:ThuA domain-containing protein n=1 Tax=Flectobacillus rivi TaxID=2984209 RepID=A0ABT6YY82_9BACT|nr:ThuA domain-containing protein [Flectobacillus rivi]MDI9873842.1 ThuA domain-containing protein [Flectobacillus rivi]
MKKAFKIIGWTLLTIVILLGTAMGLFIYKVKNGFPVSYETDKPTIDFPNNQKAILVFSKTTGFRHSASIDASKLVLKQLAQKNHWFMYETEEGGVFNPEQLAKFSTVIFDNSTGEVINDEQKRALEQYVENGGGLIGIHGAGDDSHHWDWYEQNLLGAKFSHHALAQQFQTAEIQKDSKADSTVSNGLPTSWKHADEWYVFFENPRVKGFNIIYFMGGDKIDTNGSMPILASDKNFGMGKDHPLAWCKSIGKGKTFYTSLGHNEVAWKNENFVKLIENAISWTQMK